MSRVEKYREFRRIKKKYIIAACLFFLLLLPGIAATDYSVNYLINSEKNVKIISFKLEGNYFEISLMNTKFYINAAYINKDLQKIRNTIKKYFQVLDTQ